MDVARTAIEALGGRITINNAAEGGAVARIALPQAVVMTTVMTVAVGEEHFGVPMDAVQETVRVPTGRIRAIRSGSAFVLRDRTIPFVRLCDLLKLPNTAPQGNDAKVLVTSVGGQSVGVAVSGFAERIDVLLRPMSGLLAGMPGMLGTALLGDGRVLVVLDLPELLA
jgi:two-component system chemotaxis sensor kinase CheA